MKFLNKINMNNSLLFVLVLLGMFTRIDVSISQPLNRNFQPLRKGIYIKISRVNHNDSTSSTENSIRLESMDSLESIINTNGDYIKQIIFVEVEPIESRIYELLPVLEKLYFVNIAQIPKGLNIKSRLINYQLTDSFRKNINQKKSNARFKYFIENSKEIISSLVLIGLEDFRINKFLRNNSVIKKLIVYDKINWGNYNYNIDIKNLELPIDVNDPPSIIFKLNNPERIVMYLDFTYKDSLPDWILSYNHICILILAGSIDTMTQFGSVKSEKCNR